MSERDEIWGEGFTVDPNATVARVLDFKDLPLGSSNGSRRALVEWSDGSIGEGLRWYADEILISEGDLLGKSSAELKGLKGRRDRDWLRS